MSNETNEHDQAAEAFYMGAQLAGAAARELATPMPPAEPVDPHQARANHHAAHDAARAERAKPEAPHDRCPRVGDTVMYSPGPGQPGFPAGPFPATVDVVHNPEAVDLHYEISMGEGKPPAKGIVASALLAPNRHPIGSQYTWVYPG